MYGERAVEINLLQNYTCKCYFESCACTCTYFSNSQISSKRETTHSLTCWEFRFRHCIPLIKLIIWSKSLSFIWHSARGFELTALYTIETKSLKLLGCMQMLEEMHVHWSLECDGMGLRSVFPCEQTPYP